MNNHLSDKLHRLLFVTAIMFALSCPSQTVLPSFRDNFEIIIEYVDDITSYHKLFPHVEFVYGNPNKPESGFLVVVTPHPENANWSISPNDFRVWITALDANQIKNSYMPHFSLFHTETQSLEYLEIQRKNANAFALFIGKNDIEERVPRGEIYNTSGAIDFKLQFDYAGGINSKWPLDVAGCKYHPGMRKLYNFHYKPSNNFLQCKVVGVNEADRYMDEHPEYKYFFKREEVRECMGWFLNMSYIHKNIIRDKINENHYVIFTLWKDEEHTKPLLISYMKDNLFAGGAADDASRMEERFNYVAYPHKGFDDWSLFIPWECVDYWWKDGIKATKDNHTCTAYFTLTLSNDGKTPATSLSYDDSGWLSLEKEVPCDHQKWEWSTSKNGSGSILLPGGCTRKYDIYWIGERCQKCGKTRNESYHNIYEPLTLPCPPHDFKEISRKLTDWKRVIKDGHIITSITYEVLYQCQNDCCSKIEPRYEYKTEDKPCTHEWEVISPEEKIRESKKEIGKKEERKGNKLIITTTYLITTLYEVTEQCKICNSERKTIRIDKKEVQEIEEIIIEGPQKPEPCPPHDWKDIGRKEIKREKVITDEDCFTTVITYEVISQCQKCKLEEPTREETEEIPHCHEWTYYSTKEREIVKGTKHIEPYDKDSLTIDIDSTLCMFKDTLNCQDSLRMVKETHDRQDSIRYVSTEPVSRQTWLAFNKDNNYMGFTDDDAGVLNAVTYQEAEDLIEKINEEVRKKQLNVIFNLPSVEEMRQLIKEDKVKFDADPVQPLTYFYVDSIEVYDGKGQRVPDEKLITAPEGAKLRIMVGRMNKDGEVEMVDIFTADAETGFMLVATPFTPEPKSTTSVKFYRKYWRKCNTCEIEQLITENQFRNGRYHRALIGD